MLKIKTWFVTGASSGVGKELCSQLADRGYNIIAVARRMPEFKGENILSLSVDVTKPDMIDQAVKLGIEKFGTIDVLVNNAGISQYSTCEELTSDELHNVMNVNFYGAFYTIKALLPHFRKNMNGTIINNTSQSGISIRSYGSAYCASKHALEGLTGAVWYDTQKFCRVMAVELGYFPGTEIAKNLPATLTKLKEYEGIADEDTRARGLLTVMDAYEVTGKEELLEGALERAEKLLPGMADGALKCRLYGYCHYYTGAEECREEAERILEALNQKGKLSATEKAESDACFREFVSQKA